MIAEKACKKCGDVKLLSDFYKHVNCRDGFNSQCKKCVISQQTTSYKTNLRHREIHQQHVKARRKLPTTIYSVYKGSASRRDLPFELSFEEFMSFWQKPCYYCGSEIETVGLDRIDNNSGYSLRNVVSCCSICNTTKSTLTREEFIHQCAKVAAIHG